MNDYTPKIMFFLIPFWFTLMERAASTCGGAGGAINQGFENCTVPFGETLTMTVNISFKIQNNYLYLGKGSPVVRLIKLRKGEDGTCYNETSGCKEKYDLRHSGDKTIDITIKEVTKSMEGIYGLYLYCVGLNHHGTTEQLLKSFMLITVDRPEPTEVTTVETDSDPTNQISSGKPKITQATTVTTSTGSQGADNTNHAVIAWAISATIIVVILIALISYQCYLSHCKGKKSGTTGTAKEMV